MTDAFISYSRKDSEFGHRLHTALIGQGRDIWMDWKDIPQTAEWWVEIIRGIDLSDNFVLLVSPDSIASPICNLEIDYARANNKRIIPVVIRDIREREAFVNLIMRDLNDFQRTLIGERDLLGIGRDNWHTIESLNWILFTEGQDFDGKLRDLSTALDLDIEYVHEHTRLLNRAKDWGRQGNLPSALLQDQDLRQAEIWLNTPGNKIPLPIDLQVEYIYESRRIEDVRIAEAKAKERRARNLRFASLVLGLMLVLSTVAIVIAVNRVSEVTVVQEAALHSAGTAVAKADMAATAEGLARTQANAAATAEATAISAQKTAVANEAEASTKVAVIVTQTLAPIPSTLEQINRQIEKGEDQISSLNLVANAEEYLRSDSENPDYSVLLGIAALQTFYTSQADSVLLRSLLKLPIETILDSGDSSYVLSIQYSPDKLQMLTVMDSGHVYVWNTLSQKILATIRGNSAVFSPDGKEIAVLTSDGQVVFYSNRSFDQIRSFETDVWNNRIYYSPDGGLIAAVGNALQILDSGTGEMIQQLDIGWVTHVAFSPDWQWLVTSGGDVIYESHPLGQPTALVWNLKLGTQALELIGHEGDVTAVTFSSDGRYILTGSMDQTARLWDSSNGQEIQVFRGHQGSIASVAISSDSSMVATGSGSAWANSDNSVRLWNLESGAQLQAFSTPKSGIISLAFSPDGSTLAAGSLDGAAYLFRIARSNPILLWGHTDPISSIAFSEDGTQLFSGTTSGDFRKWDVQARTQIWSVLLNTGIRDITMQNAMPLILDEKGVVSELSSEDILVPIFEPQTPLVGQQFSQSGELMLTTSITENRETQVQVWDISRKREVFANKLDPITSLMAVAMSPDNQYLAISDDINGVVLWNVTQNQPHCTIGAFKDTYIVSLQFSSTSTLLFGGEGTGRFAGVGRVSSIHAWNVDSCHEVLLQTGDLADINSLASTSNGRYLLGSGTDVQVWDIDNQELVRTIPVRDFVGSISRIAISPDDQWAAIGTNSGDIYVVPIGIQDTIDFACQFLSLEDISELSFYNRIRLLPLCGHK